MSQKVELLAPAGNPEGFYGAIHAGADAVYLGGTRFGARAYADNFTTEELVECIRYAHIWGRKVYLTVNTLVKETEFADLFPYLEPLYSAGLDGVIVQDIGVFCFIREHFPDIELHVSTQMTLTSWYGAALLKEMGAVRIVPARELSLRELQKMKEVSGLQIETFIHGAMCYCYSGQCLFSSILGGRSGNRGRCAQPCRLPYRVERMGRTTEECYPLSLKDMCTIEHIPELIEAGIDSFKIEGRMKKPEYTAGVTAVYRKYIDRYYAGESCEIEERDRQALSELYIRSERQEGYYFRHNGRDMVTISSPSYSGGSESLLAEIREHYLAVRPRMKLNIKASFHVGSPAQVVLRLEHDDKKLHAEVSGEVVSEALKQPITKDNVIKQLSRLGDTAFQAEHIDIELDDNAFYPLKAMNELRRQAVAALEELLIREQGLPFCRQNARFPVQCTAEDRTRKKQFTQDSSKGNLHVLLRTKQQLEAFHECFERYKCVDGIQFPNRVYLESDCILSPAGQADSRVLECCRQFLTEGCSPVIALPYIIRNRDEEFMSGLWNVYCAERDLFQGFLVRSMDGLGFLKSKHYGEKDAEFIFTDAGLYIWNRESLLGLAPNGFCMPYELKAQEQRRLLDGAKVPCEKVVYGRIPLMITANCITNTLDGCSKGQGAEFSYLIDRYKKHFPVLKNCRHCMNIIYNSLPLSLHGELSKWRSAVDFRLDFTIESRQETTDILHYFMTGAKGVLPFAEHTTGHEKRGAE